MNVLRKIPDTAVGRSLVYVMTLVLTVTLASIVNTPLTSQPEAQAQTTARINILTGNDRVGGRPAGSIINLDPTGPFYGNASTRLLGDTLYYTAAGFPQWASINPNPSSTETGSPGVVTADFTGVAPGIYTLPVTISHPDESSEIVNIPTRVLPATGNNDNANTYYPLYDEVAIPSPGHPFVIPSPKDAFGGTIPAGTVFAPGAGVPSWATVNSSGTVRVNPPVGTDARVYEFGVVATFPDGTSSTATVAVRVGTPTNPTMAFNIVPQYTPMSGRVGESKMSLAPRDQKGMPLYRGAEFRLVPKARNSFPTSAEAFQTTHRVRVGRDGYARINVPVVSTGYWVVPYLAPLQYTALDALTVGDAYLNNPVLFERYGWHTGPMTRSTTTVNMPKGTPGNNESGALDARREDSGTAPFSRINPPVSPVGAAVSQTGSVYNSPACFPEDTSISMGLVMDVSNSTQSGSEGFLAYERLNPTYRSALNSFVTTLSTRENLKVQGYTFGTTSPAGTSLNARIAGRNNEDSREFSMSVGSDVSGLRNYISNITVGDATSNMAGTNWDEGLSRAEGKDVVVFVTDGMPTADRAGPNNRMGENIGWVKKRNIEYAVMTANRLKSQGTRVIAVAAGNGANSPEAEKNLRAISGQLKGVDYFVAPTWADLAQQLNDAITGETCTPIMDINKMADSATITPNADGTATASYSVTVTNRGESRGEIGYLTDLPTITDGTVVSARVDGVNTPYDSALRSLTIDGSGVFLEAHQSRTFNVEIIVRPTASALANGVQTCNTVRGNPAWPVGADPSGAADNGACISITPPPAKLDVSKTRAATSVTLDASGNAVVPFDVVVTNDGTVPVPIGNLSDIPVATGGNITRVLVNDVDRTNAKNAQGQVQLISPTTSIAPGKTTYRVLVHVNYDLSRIQSGAVTAAQLNTGVCNTIRPEDWAQGWNWSGTANDSACVAVNSPPGVLDISKTAVATSKPINADGTVTVSYNVTVTNTGYRAVNLGTVNDTPRAIPGATITQVREGTTVKTLTSGSFQLGTTGTSIQPGESVTYQVHVDYQFDTAKLADGTTTIASLTCNADKTTGAVNTVTPSGWESTWDPSGTDNNVACTSLTYVAPSIKVTKYINDNDANTVNTATLLDTNADTMVVKVTVENTGSMSLEGFSVKDIISSGNEDASYIESMLQNVTMTVDGNVVTQLAPGQIGVLEVVVNSPELGVIHTGNVTVTATVVGGTATVEDSDPANAFRMPGGIGLPNTGSTTLAWMSLVSVLLALLAAVGLALRSRKDETEDDEQKVA